MKSDSHTGISAFSFGGHTDTTKASSLRTRSFAQGGGRVWACAYVRFVPRSKYWPDYSFANYVMEILFSVQWQDTVGGTCIFL